MGKENQFELLDAAIAVTQALDGVEVETFFKDGNIAEMTLYHNLADYPIKSIEDLDEFVERFPHAE